MTAGDEGLPRISGLTEIAVGVSRLIYIYGQVADHSELDVREQLRSALGHVDRLLQGAGGRPAHILSVAMNRRRHVRMGPLVSRRTGRFPTAGVREGPRRWPPR
jgi:hypothetical protein